MIFFHSSVGYFIVLLAAEYYFNGKILAANKNAKNRTKIAFKEIAAETVHR